MNEFIEGIISNNYAVDSNFLDQNELQIILTEFNLLYSQGLFKKAAIGKSKIISDEIRGDEIFWVDESIKSEAQKILWSKLIKVKTLLNQNLMMGLWDFEGHFAIYQKGTKYKKHLDTFKSDDARLISFVLYLNKEWEEEDGGHLKLYFKDKNKVILPRGGTLVCFLSHKIEHEVCECFKSRLSFTGWFKKRSI